MSEQVEGGVLRPRRESRKLKLGQVEVGGGAKISVQSMCTTKTHQVDETLWQISELAMAGCDIVRLGVPGKRDVDALKAIVERSPIPVVADIHFQAKFVLAAIEAGCAGVRVNPGNIRHYHRHAREIVAAAEAHGTVLRIGVNAGSLDPDILKQHTAASGNPQTEAADRDNSASRNQPPPLSATKSEWADLLVKSALQEAKLFEQYQFHNFKISVKHHDPLVVIAANRKLAAAGTWSLHLGVTEAGLKDVGIVKNVSALAILLSEGIGDTIRISLTDQPIEEVKAGIRLLESLGLRPKGLDIIACPTCARTNVNVIELTRRVESALANCHTPLTVAVMGCEVNGPGEAREADLGIAAGNGIGHIFVKGQIVRSVPEAKLLPELLKEIRKLSDFAN